MSATPPIERSRGRGIAKVLAIWAVPMVLGFGLWVFSSPVGANPDEPSHIIYAWSIATGQGFGDADISCGEGVRPCPQAIVEVPAGLVAAPGCYAFKPAVPAACASTLPAGIHGTYMVRYPPLFYGVVGATLRGALALGFDGGTAAYLGRLVSALISVSLIAPALALAWRHARRLVPALIVLLTPMALFMIGAINPSGVEITAATAAATAVVVLAGSTRHWPAHALLCYALTWLTWSRPLGFLWTAAIVAFGMLFIAISDTAVRPPRQLLRDGAGTLAVAVANISGGVAWFVYATQIRKVGGSGNGPTATVPDAGIERYLAVALRWGDMIWENVGVLGWLDTPLPTLVMLATVSTLAVTLYEPLFEPDVDVRRRRIATLYTAAIVAGTSFIMFYQKFLWQGRYAMPALAAGYILLIGASHRSLSRRLLGPAIAAWMLGVLGAMWFYARHVYGIQAGARHAVVNLSDGAQWFGPLGSYGYLIGAIVTAASLPVALLVAHRHDAAAAPTTL